MCLLKVAVFLPRVPRPRALVVPLLVPLARLPRVVVPLFAAALVLGVREVLGPCDCTVKASQTLDVAVLRARGAGVFPF